MNKGVKDIEFTTSWSKMTKVGGQSIKDFAVDQNVSTNTTGQGKTYRELTQSSYYPHDIKKIKLQKINFDQSIHIKYFPHISKGKF